LNLALKRVNTTVATPYLYSQMGFAALGGWLVFGCAPDLFSWIGMGLIATCGIANAWLAMRDNKA